MKPGLGIEFIGGEKLRAEQERAASFVVRSDQHSVSKGKINAIEKGRISQVRPYAGHPGVVPPRVLPHPRGQPVMHVAPDLPTV